MEERNENKIHQQEESGYAPRPMWQIWGARIGVVIMILLVIWQILQIAGVGL